MYLVFNIIFSPAYLESCSLWYDLKDIFPVQELGIKFIYMTVKVVYVTRGTEDVGSSRTLYSHRHP